MNEYAPEGEGLADIVALFADDHDIWQDTFFTAWEKLLMNGYSANKLTVAPANGNLQAPEMTSN